MNNENKEFLDFVGLLCFLVVTALVIIALYPGVN